MSRVDRDRLYLSWAKDLGEKRGTCARRKVGCVLTNKRGHMISCGYNGPPSGEKHCIDYPCPGADLPSGQYLSTCEAVHAEANALLQCPDVYQIDICYSSTSPCLDCIKLLMNTSCRRIVFIEEYPHPEARDRWLKLKGTGRQWLQIKD